MIQRLFSLITSENKKQPFDSMVSQKMINECEYQLGCYVVQVITDSSGHAIIRHVLDKNYRKWLPLLEQVEESLMAEIRRIHSSLDELLPFRELSNQLWHSYQRMLDQAVDDFSEKKMLQNMYYYLFFKIFGIKTLGPFLIDRLVHEIYVEEGGNTRYLDHEIWGRCIIENSITKEEIDRIISLVLLENNAVLSRMNPSFKGDLVSRDFHLRISIDAPPLSVDGVQLDVRKIFPYHFHLFRLLHSGTINVRIFSLLLVAMRFGSSITIIGSPGTGKTTLQNSLLQFLPSHWRVISIEDAIESPPYLFSHHVRLKVSERDEQLGIDNKVLEGLKLLRRSPDYVNMGEISRQIHAQAWFQVLAAGIPSIQTIHGRNMVQLLVRLKDIFKIPVSLISSSVPHLLMEIQSFWSDNKKVRRVTSVGEIKINSRFDSARNAMMSATSDIDETRVDLCVLNHWDSKLEQWIEDRTFGNSDSGRFICLTHGFSTNQLDHLVSEVENILTSGYQVWKERVESQLMIEKKKDASSHFKHHEKFDFKNEMHIINECYQKVNSAFCSINPHERF